LALALLLPYYRPPLMRQRPETEWLSCNHHGRHAAKGNGHPSTAAATTFPIAEAAPHPLGEEGECHRAGEGRFQVPMVPFLPLVALWLNWYLIAQLPALGLLSLVLYVLAAVGHYLCYGLGRSVGNSTGWQVILDMTYNGG
ncbi:unnamed protein product, partial [Discosporangium mesarthrocarpum]